MKNKLLMLIVGLICINLLVGFCALRELAIPGDAAAFVGLGLMFALGMLNLFAVRRWRKQLLGD